MVGLSAPRTSPDSPSQTWEAEMAIPPRNGGGTDDCLRRIELQLTGIKAQLDVKLKHVATKAWVLGSVLAGMGVAATIATAVAVAYRTWAAAV